MDSELTWTRSGRCAASNCVEIADTGTTVLLRDSKNPGQAPSAFSYDEWREFAAAVKRGEFDQW
ncbi:hypothetical protein Ade02nite_19490 [Paractinoplanes deccanensis]|uniref:DUF397 domain-containing protein n=1 Tax=Paractinoplanes deccanensis TaxID=113561 RepID=A0ABQ3XZY9_9ACTN|nr:DUF397 domain-containing protein [Actinoplanes deccanensis]GID73308.1 hypothetical protein Ade02nite_19490 [Actinoplanes deccanensis]